MRITTITSTITSVANRVIDVVAVTGSLRAFLHHPLMRERLGHWRALFQALDAFAAGYQAKPLTKPGTGGPGDPCYCGRLIAAPVLCTAPSRLMSNGMTSHG